MNTRLVRKANRPGEAGWTQPWCTVSCGAWFAAQRLQFPGFCFLPSTARNRTRLSLTLAFTYSIWRYHFATLTKRIIFNSSHTPSIPFCTVFCAAASLRLASATKGISDTVAVAAFVVGVVRSVAHSEATALIGNQMVRPLTLKRESETSEMEGGDALLPLPVLGALQAAVQCACPRSGQDAALHGASGTAKQRSCTIICIS